jgi:hypothetical protein
MELLQAEYPIATRELEGLKAILGKKSTTAGRKMGIM